MALFESTWSEALQEMGMDFDDFPDFSSVCDQVTLPYHSDDRCWQCSGHHHIFDCPNLFPEREPFSFQALEEALPATISAQQGNRNVTPPQRQEMESSDGAGAVTAQATTLPENSHITDQASGMTPHDFPDFIPDIMAEQGQQLAETPHNTQYVDHLQSSNVRELAEEVDVPRPDSEHEATLAANILANGTINVRSDVQAHEFQLFSAEELIERMNRNTEGATKLEKDIPAGHAFPDERTERQITDGDPDPRNAKAYAKLVFPDGDLYITTHDVMIGRNPEVWAQLKQRKKQEKRAQRELHTYRQEPSQPSQPGDEDQQGNPSSSGQSLEGRPAPPSNFSEHGGPVWYPPHSEAEAEMHRPRSKRRKSQFSKSSSTTSVAPANLHPSMMPDFASATLFTADGEPEFRTFTFIPIHTPVPEDITKISKEHLMFSFNFIEERWELLVMGNRAFVNDQLFEQDELVALDHNDEIMIASVHMTFKLPDNYRRSPGLSRGTFSVDSDDDEESVNGSEPVSTSPVRRLSTAMEAEESDADSEEEDQRVEEKGGRKKPKLKIEVKPKKTKPKFEKAKAQEKQKKANAKPQKKKESSSELSPEAPKKAEKGKKPKAAAKEPAEPKPAKEDVVSPPAAPVIQPGSVLEGIPLEELPEKRKGPGRPPKEGNVSKRDTALANRRKKEYEKRGVEPPTFKELVDEVRRESKNKEALAKLQANGQLPPGMQIVQSIESDPTAPVAKTNAIAPIDASGQPNATPTEPAKRASPKVKRNAKSPSPFKPKSAYTEEELKKPPGTYVHFLDEVLRQGPADLQEIYHRVQKRYPFYKYCIDTPGWQSSIRHNLQQSERFQIVGRSGKGKLWEINYDSPLEKEKKRRATPPPRPPMQNGQFMPGQMPPPQYGHQYGNPYAQHQPNGQPANGPQPGSGQYVSPYVQPGQHAQYGAPNGMAQPSSYSQHQRAPHQQRTGAGPTGQVQPINPFGGLVEEIMGLREKYLSQFKDDPLLFEAQQTMFNGCTNVISELFQGDKPRTEITEQSQTEDEKFVKDRLESLFLKYKHHLTKPGGQGASGTDTAAGEVQKAVDNTQHEVNAATEVGGEADSAAAPPAVAQADQNASSLAQPANASTPPYQPLMAPSMTTEQPHNVDSPAAPQPPSAPGPSSGNKRAAGDDEQDGPDAKRAKTDGA